MQNTRSIGQILKKQLALPGKAAGFTDVRHKPQIPLKNIVLSFCLMAVYSIRSMLKFDYQSRVPQFKRLFGKLVELRKMVCSDSTLQRAIRWIKPEEARRFQMSFLSDYRRMRCWAKQIAPNAPFRKIGIIDGSVMNKNHLVALALFGTVIYPVMVEACSGRGMELTQAKKLIDSLSERLGESCPELLLFDGLYFNAPIFKHVCENGMHILVKCGDPNFRTVFKDAKFLFDSGTMAGNAVSRQKGYDEKRLCIWCMEKTSDTFAGYPVIVTHLVEEYAKDRKNPHRESWIITTDWSLSLEEIREAAHVRWSIENDEFKKLSGLTATKRFHCKDQSAFLTMLMLFCAAVTAFELALQILMQKPLEYKEFLNGIKPTVAGLFMRLALHFRAGIFS